VTHSIFNGLSSQRRSSCSFFGKLGIARHQQLRLFCPNLKSKNELQKTFGVSLTTAS
jgi:hypothetical protein